jgi:lysophospholipase L1-like esterase
MRMRWFLEKAAHWIGVLWAQLGLLILCLLILNAMAGVIVRNVSRFRKRDHPVPEDAYRRSPWTAAYFKALKRSGSRWYPYVYWKSSPMSSPYLNVDQQGDRVTWNKPSRNDRPTLSVFAFGGSTTWGYGVRDDYTLASLLAKRLAEKTDYKVEVLNYGQMGYVTTQEVLLLYQLLAQGMRPDVVVFYDGINDCFAAYQAGIAGLTQNESFRVREFNLVGGNRSRRKNLYLTAIRTLLFHSNAARLGRLIAGKDSDEEAGENVEAREMLSYLAPHSDHRGAERLEQDVVSRYVFNQQMVRMLGKQFGFRSLFYWQPAVFFKDKLTPFERSFPGDPQREKFFLATYGRMAAAAQANGVRDLSGIFKNNPEICFTDAWHPTESANELIADSMSDDVAKVLAEIERDRGINPGRVGTATIPSR